MSFTFNAVELCVVAINEKPWARAREVCKALEYGKAIKTAHVIKAHVSPENYAHKWQLSSVSIADTPINWRKDSQKYDIYTVIFKSTAKGKRLQRTLLQCTVSSCLVAA